MVAVVVYHHAQGLTEGVRAFADRLAAAGHAVTVPDLYEGRTFDTLEEGLGYARATGFGVLLDRGRAAGEAAPEDAVYAGFSLGAMSAQMMAQTRPGAKGALLFHSCIPPAEFGAAWPSGVPVQVHGMESDPLFTEEGGDLDAARALVGSTSDAELFLYPGDQHLFADSSLRSYDAEAAGLLEQCVLAFLDTVG
jgi:dienelactone hydrolase